MTLPSHGRGPGFKSQRAHLIGVFMRCAKKACFIILLFLILLTAVYFTGNNYERARVKKVIDGDTILLEDGRKVRLLSINAPERGQRYYEDAKAFLKGMVEGKMVVLERDVAGKDEYGRALRYVYINSTFINLEMVKKGLAIAYIIEPNTKYKKIFIEAERYAIKNKLGMWSTHNFSSCRDCIKIKYFHFDARGNDCKNANDEYVVFENICKMDCDLTNWSVQDESNNIYIFKNYTLRSGKTVTLHSGDGIDTEEELYWNNKKSCKAVWNNNGDTLF